MNFRSILMLALLAVPVALPAYAKCSVNDLKGDWTYYAYAGGPDPYTVTCAVQVSSGTITAGQCTTSGGVTLAASGTLLAVDRSVCSFSGALTYPSTGVTETLSALTLSKGKDALNGVGTNGPGLLFVSFMKSH